MLLKYMTAQSFNNHFDAQKYGQQSKTLTQRFTLVGYILRLEKLRNKTLIYAEKIDLYILKFTR